MVKFFKLKIKEEQPLIECVFTVIGSKKRAKKLINEGLCSVNGLKELFYRRKVKAKSSIYVSLNHLLFDEKRIEKLYEDEYILIINKPPFINSNKDVPNVEEILRRENKNHTVVHRLDKQTSGALIVAKERRVFESFKELFRKRKVKKVYLSIVAGNFKKKSGKVNVPLDGKPSETLFRVLEEFNGTSLLEVEIPTGRKHQIRRHLSLINHPVLGEFNYWKRKWDKEIHLFAPRILLHARKLEFPHPILNKTVSVKAPFPEDFKLFLKILRGEEELKVIEKEVG
jgi:RluA family pseudouridine synthase